MDKKGQIFSVDFLISVIVIVLAIGLLLNFYELTVHAQAERNSADELKIASERAADLLVSSPELVCELVESGDGTNHIMYLPNCLVTENSEKEITKEKLGLIGFSCNLSGPGAGGLINQTGVGCTDTFPGDKDVVAVKRTIYLTMSNEEGNQEIKKDEYLGCINATSGCSIEGRLEIYLKVWKP
jgi:uncharacterized protein (UPF0333 family)